MCKSCKFDPSEIRKEAQRQGAVDPDDFYEETNYQKRIGKSKPKKAGCPENNNKRHINGWVTEVERPHDSSFYEYFGFRKFEYSVCLGCGKDSQKRRLTDEYKDRFGYRQYSGEEYLDEGYLDFLQKNNIKRNYMWDFS